MTMIEALLLGIIQGLSEFIPISSTAHLTIAASLLGVIDPTKPEQWTAFMATIQLGTLVAVVAYFRGELLRMVTAFIQENLGSGRLPLSRQSADSRLTWYVALGTIPIVLVGLLAKDAIEGVFTKDLRVIAASLMLLAGVLWYVDRRATHAKTTATMTLMDALVIGLSQCLALVPGASRSGTTMTAALALGQTRESAARFSFLLSIPAILGAGVVQFLKVLEHLSWESGGPELLAATVAAGVSGYWSIAFLLGFLRSRTMNVFIVYRMVIGVALFVLVALSIVRPLP